MLEHIGRDRVACRGVSSCSTAVLGMDQAEEFGTARGPSRPMIRAQCRRPTSDACLVQVRCRHGSTRCCPAAARPVRAVPATARAVRWRCPVRPCGAGGRDVDHGGDSRRPPSACSPAGTSGRPSTGTRRCSWPAGRVHQAFEKGVSLPDPPARRNSRAHGGAQQVLQRRPAAGCRPAAEGVA